MKLFKMASIGIVVSILLTGCAGMGYGPRSENNWMKTTAKDKAERDRDDQLLSMVLEQYHQTCNKAGGRWKELPPLPNNEWFRIYHNLTSGVVVLPDGSTMSTNAPVLEGWQAYIATRFTNYAFSWKSAQCEIGTSELRPPIADVQAYLDGKGFVHSGSAVFGAGVYPKGIKRWSPVDVEILRRQAGSAVNLD